MPLNIEPPVGTYYGDGVPVGMGSWFSKLVHKVPPILTAMIPVVGPALATAQTISNQVKAKQDQEQAQAAAQAEYDAQVAAAQKAADDAAAADAAKQTTALTNPVSALIPAGMTGEQLAMIGGGGLLLGALLFRRRKQ